MAKAEVKAEEFDALPEALQAEYKPVEGQDGVYRLEVSPVNGLQLTNPTKLQTALQKERSALEDLRKKFKPFESLDPDETSKALEHFNKFKDGEIPDEAKERIAALETQLKDKYEKLSAQEREKLTKDLNALKDRYEATKGQLHKTTVQSKALSAIHKLGGNDRLLLPIVTQRVRPKERDDGSWEYEVIGDDGTPRLSTKSGSSDPMSIEEYVEELKNDDGYAQAFSGSSASGSGSTGGSGGGGGGASNGIFKISAADAKNPTKYQAARAQADKQGARLEIV